MSTDARFIGSFPAHNPHLAPRLPEVAFAGRSNVGKSSLINALLGRRRLAHVSRTPGKTRTLNIYAMGGRLYLVDLPGYGYARASKSDRAAWRSVVQRYLQEREELRGIVWLLDIRRDPSHHEVDLHRLLAQAGRPILAALTKCDKVPRRAGLERARTIGDALGLADDQIVLTSSITKTGIDQLREAVEQLI